jgi:hypothetical protein
MPRALLDRPGFSVGRLFGRPERARKINAQSGTTYTLLPTDLGALVTLSNASSIAVTLPQSGTAGFPRDWSVELANINDGVVTVTPTTSTINGASTLRLSRGMSAVIAGDGTNYSASVKGGPAKQTIWVPATAMITRTDTAGGGPSTTTSTASTNKNVFKSLDFDTTTQEFAQFTVAFPKGWDLGTVTFIPYWKAGSGSGGVTWGVAGLASSDNDTIDTAFGTAQTSADTFISGTVVHVGPESSAITIAGTPAIGDIVAFQVNRTVADANDTLAVDAQLIGIKLIYNLNASSDN